MSVPLNVTQAARNMFQDGMDHLAQQMHSRFREFALVKTGVKGRASAHRKIRPGSEMQDSTGRLQQTQGEEVNFEHRYIFPKKAVKTSLLDEDDAATLELDVAPTGDIMIEHGGAAERKVDSIFISGITGINYEGQEDAMAQVTIPNSMIVPVDYVHTGGATNSGLTLAKIVRGKGLFGRNEVLGQNQKMEGAKICMAVSQDDLDNLLLNVQQVSSADYNKVQALVNGEVDYFAGVHFIRSEQVPTADAGGGKVVKTLPMWLNKGVYLDFWYDVKTNIDVLPTVSQAIQVYSRLKAGAARKEEKYVALIMSENNAYTF